MRNRHLLPITSDHFLGGGSCGSAGSASTRGAPSKRADLPQTHSSPQHGGCRGRNGVGIYGMEDGRSAHSSRHRQRRRRGPGRHHTGLRIRQRPLRHTDRPDRRDRCYFAVARLKPLLGYDDSSMSSASTGSAASGERSPPGSSPRRRSTRRERTDCSSEMRGCF